MRCYWTIGGLLVLGIFGRVGWGLQYPAEPAYAGKTATQWLDAGYEDSAMAMQQLGPAAAPYVLLKLSREDPRYGTRRSYRRVWAKLPTPLRLCMPRPKPANFDQLRAASILLEFGPPILPLLSRSLRAHNPAVRRACARALLSLRQQGSNIGPALPALADASRDPDPELAALAASALGLDAGRAGSPFHHPDP